MVFSRTPLTFELLLVFSFSASSLLRHVWPHFGSAVSHFYFHVAADHAVAIAQAAKEGLELVYSVQATKHNVEGCIEDTAQFSSFGEPRQLRCIA
jgi:hypothetical protein